MKSVNLNDLLPSGGQCATAIGASLAAQVGADAAVVYSGLQNRSSTAVAPATSSASTQGPAVTLDLNGNGQNNFNFTPYATGGSSSRRVGISGVDAVNPLGLAGLAEDPATANLRIFSSNEPINAAAFTQATPQGRVGFQSAIVTSMGASTQPAEGLAEGETGLLGLRIQIAGATHYGWARVRVDALSPGTEPNITAGLTLVDFAFEDVANTPIAAGAVPEPSSLALLALGAVGLTTVRNRKKAS